MSPNELKANKTPSFNSAHYVEAPQVQNKVAHQIVEVPQVLNEVAHQIWGDRLGVDKDKISAPVSWTIKYSSFENNNEFAFTKEALTPNMVTYAYMVAENATRPYKLELAKVRTELELALEALNNSSAVVFKDMALASERGKAIDAVSAALERKVIDWLPPRA